MLVVQDAHKNGAIYSEALTCRACGSPKLVELFSLGSQYASDFVTDESKPIQAPLTLIRCIDCSLVQLRHTVNRDLLYRHYYYRSGTNQVMVAALRDVIDGTIKRYPRSVDRKNVWVDVGSNDGTLLRQIPQNFIRVGYEPAKNLIPDDPTMRIVPDYFSATKYREILHQKPAIISACAMFYDLDEPRKFLHDIADLLQDEGVFVVQQNYLGSMLANNAYDNIGHEHLCYYSLTSLKPLLESEGLEVFDVEVNAVNGGSFRTFISNKGAYPISKSVAKLLGYEAQNLTPEAYTNFVKRIERGRDRLRKFLGSCKREGRRVYGLGASNRGNTILQYCGIDDKLLTAIAEVDPHKYGRRTVGTNIPICSEQEMHQAKPRYLLILPYFYLQHFITKEYKFLEAGGRLIVPVPEPRIIRRVEGELKVTQVPI